jgi:hypothetical protein
MFFSWENDEIVYRQPGPPVFSILRELPKWTALPLATRHKALIHAGRIEKILLVGEWESVL